MVYNKHSQSHSFKKKTLLVAYIGKTSFNVDGTIVHSSISILPNCKNSPSLNLVWLG
jgi:hypothetical protein